MIFTFLRHIKPDEGVEAKITINTDGVLHQIGVLKFPNKLIWSRFYGSIQNGSISMKDLEVRMENAAEGFSSTITTGGIKSLILPTTKKD